MQVSVPMLKDGMVSVLVPSQVNKKADSNVIRILTDGA